MPPILGIDIGNAFAYVSVLEANPADARAEQRDPTALLPFPYVSTGGVSTNVTALPDGTLAVAQGVRNSSVKPLPPRKRTILRAIKTVLHHDQIECVNSDNEHFFVQTAKMYAAIVKEMVAIANVQLAENGHAPIYDVLLAVPAVFHNGDNSRLVLDKIHRCVSEIELDGHKLTLHGTIPEPAAIALDYMHYMQYTVAEPMRVTKDNFTVIVYDLGQGTFDTALVTVNRMGEPYRLLHQSGLPYGGKNMDDAILNWFLMQISQKVQDETLIRRAEKNETLLNLVTSAKEHLSTAEYWEDEFSFASDSFTLSLSRKEFESMITQDVTSTIEQLDMMLNYARENKIAVDCIVLSGGCSKIPHIQQRITEWASSPEAGNIPVRPPYRTSEAVSFGAARYAFRQSQLDRLTRYTYSVLLDSDAVLSGELLAVIPPKQSLPYTTQPIQLKNQGNGEFWVCRNLDDRDPLDQKPLEPRKRLMRFRVKLPPRAPFLATFTISEEYLLSVRCQLPDGSDLPVE